jgi:predicted DNA-binding protein with PD1-like motif
MGSTTFSRGATVVARLQFGADLLDAIAEVAQEHGVTTGGFRAIGALQRGRLSFYDQLTPDPHNRTYDAIELEEPLEIVSLLGTVSLREGEPSVHAHACLSDSSGRCFGGHVEHGCAVFACELVLDGLEGPALERGYDSVTGLWLWKSLQATRRSERT